MISTMISTMIPTMIYGFIFIVLSLGFAPKNPPEPTAAQQQEVRALFQQGLDAHKKGDLKETQRFVEAAVAKAIEVGDKAHLPMIYSALSMTYDGLDNMKEAYDRAKKSYQSLKEAGIDDKEVRLTIGLSMDWVGHSLTNQSQHTRALEL